MTSANKHWNTEEVEILKKNYPEMRIENLCEMLGRTWQSIGGKAKRLGIKRNIMFSYESMGSLDLLLQETCESFYWIGFILADGHLRKPCGFSMNLASKDVNHLEKIAKFLKYKKELREVSEKPYGLYAMSFSDPDNFFDFVDKFSICSRKTYMPPNISEYEFNDDLLFSLIVGFIDGDNVYIGGDRAGVAGVSHLRIREDEKVFKKNGFVFGYTSSFRMGQLIRFKFDPPKHRPEEKDDFEYMCTDFIDELRQCLKDGGYSKNDSNVETGGTFLVGYRGKLYQIESDFQVAIMSGNFDACGCGEDYAMGAMSILSHNDKISAHNKIIEALKVAENLSAGVRGPFDVVKIGGKDAEEN